MAVPVGGHSGGRQGRPQGRLVAASTRWLPGTAA